ncbi:MAG TPA: hypothetical protein VGG04_00210 [Candidatus Sulfotelmatobacter sp.]|jgi:hypothetical protein
MQEGWYDDEYLILFDRGEIAEVSDRYQISQMLHGYEIVGLRGWDDFIVRDTPGHTYSVPAVVPQLRYLSPFTLPNDRTVLTADHRFAGKIKWYIKPILFGGSVDLGENATWVTHEQHAELVRWWCERYRRLKAQPSDVRR